MRRRIGPWYCLLALLAGAGSARGWAEEPAAALERAVEQALAAHAAGDEAALDRLAQGKEPGPWSVVAALGKRQALEPARALARRALAGADDGTPAGRRTLLRAEAALSAAGLAPEAAAALDRTEEAARRDGSALDEAAALERRSARLPAQERERRAALLGRCVELREGAGDGPGAARAALARAELYGPALSEAQTALALRELALAVAERAADPGLVGACLDSLGWALAQLGEPEKALPLHERAIPLHERAQNPRGALNARICRAQALGALGRHDEARTAQAAVVAEADAQGLAELRWVGRLNLSVELKALGLLEEAATTLKEALALAPNADAESRVLLNLAGVVSDLGDQQAALAWVRRGQEAQTKAFGQIGFVMRAQEGIVRFRAGDAAGALPLLREALRSIGDATSTASLEQAMTVRAGYVLIPSHGARAAARAGTVEDFFWFSEEARAATLLEGLLRSRLRTRREAPEALRDAERAAQARLAAARARRRALPPGTPGASRRAAAAAVAAAERELKDVLDRVERALKQETRGSRPEAATLEEIRARLGADEALVSYYWPGTEAWAVVVERAGARLVRLPATNAEVAAALAALAEALPDRRSDPRAAIAAFRALAVDPLGLAAEVGRVLVVPEDRMGTTPLAQAFGGREVVLAPSATAWRVLAEQGRGRGEGVLALGDPDYRTEASAPQGDGQLRAGERLRPLPWTREEARSVGDVVLLGPDANEARLRREAAARPRWRAIHLACHGIFRPDEPTLSCLALTPVGEDDGFLTAREVALLDLRADLAVLSACETARGELVWGDGLVGLVPAFMEAGCPRVLVSAWPVEDRATRALMGHFYARLAAGDRAATALGAAQAAVRATEGWEHPFYWDAWLLWGPTD